MTTRKGTAGNDLLLGTKANDLLIGLAGDDRLLGGAGQDILRGGAGNDRLYGGAAIDSLRGDAGDDTYVIDHATEIVKSFADPGFDTVVATFSYTLGAQQERLILGGHSAAHGIGQAGANTLIGNDANNLLRGGGGNDRLDGGAGNDRLDGGSGHDRLVGGAGRDILSGRADDDVLFYDAADIRIDGGAGFDSLVVTTGTVDLTRTAPLVSGIERIDLVAVGTQSLRLDVETVGEITTAPHLLAVRGSSDDRVALDGYWTPRDEVVSGYRRFESGAAKVDIDNDIALTTTSVIDLGLLNGSDGSRLLRVADFTQTGRAIAHAGDVNGDGYDDFFISEAHGPAGLLISAAYVVFGGPSAHPATFDIGTVNGTTGFRIDGPVYDDYSGWALVSAGDVNGDGLDDLLIGMDDTFNPIVGAAYVVFGKSGEFAPTLSLTALTGDNGFALTARAPVERTGRDVADAGDINGDGFDDFIVDQRQNSYGVIAGPVVVLGHGGAFAATQALADIADTSGFRIVAATGSQTNRMAISSAGDLNGDGFDELLIGAPDDPVNGLAAAGTLYVIMGKASGLDQTFRLDDFDASSGFRIDGGHAYDVFGVAAAAAGDINGDGLDDIAFNAGGTKVLFGRADGFGATFDVSTLDGHNGFSLIGASKLAAAGDVNGDGFDDLLISASGADTQQAHAGKSYIIFGGSSFDAFVDVDSLDGSKGFRLDGALSNSFSGDDLSGGGDLNGDGYDDILIGTQFCGGYVVYGRDFTNQVALEGHDGNDSLRGTSNAEIIVGGRGNDLLDGAGGADALRGGAGDDVLVWHPGLRDADGGGGIDTLRVGGAEVTLNLSLIANATVSGIDVIDLAGSGANHLEFALTDVLALTDHNTLRIAGNAGDSVASVAQGWTLDVSGPISLGGQAYSSYSSGGAHLLIDTDITQIIS